MLKQNRELYIYERGNCNNCGIHKPLNYLGVCEICDKTKICPNCGQQIDRPVEDAEEKLKMATSFETGKGIYYAILDHKFRSIELCNWCYSVMQTYRHSIPKEERLEKENRSNSSQS
jgi:hypothetical protein